MLNRNNLILFILLATFTTSYSQPSYIYEGGDGNGFASDEATAINAILYKGDSGSGYAGELISTINSILYKGSDSQGYSSIAINPQNTILYKGGQDDGYTSEYKIVDFIWTGVLGEGWNVPGNWNYNIIPDLIHKTIIPTDVPNYPHLNAGLFAIGKNPNDGIFQSGGLWIQENALLVTRVNNLVENYGKIVIEGVMEVKNSANNALQNKIGSSIKIENTGALIIKP